MKKDSKELKKSAFLNLRDQGYTYVEIKDILNCSERTLYNWANENDDEVFEQETQQATEVVENKQQLEIEELKEHIEQLSKSYTNLWNQVHLKQAQPVEISPFQRFFEVMMENSEKNTILLNQQMDRCSEIEMEMEKREGRWSKTEVCRDLHFTEEVEQMKQWNRRVDIKKGRIPADNLETEDQHNPGEPQLLMETAEGRRFEQNIAEIGFRREIDKIVDKAFQRNPKLETS